MKSFALIATLISFAVAAPTVLEARKETCPAIVPITDDGYLPKDTLSPEFLLPVSRKHPHKTFKAGQKAQITKGDLCTLTKFNIPAKFKNNTCSLVLTLGGCGETIHEKGDGNITFAGNTGVTFPKPGYTNYANQPVLAPPFTDAPFILKGNAYRLGGGPCDYKEGQAFASVGGSVCSDTTDLSFVESYGGHGKCPVGFHIIIS